MLVGFPAWIKNHVFCEYFRNVIYPIQRDLRILKETSVGRNIQFLLIYERNQYNKRRASARRIEKSSNLQPPTAIIISDILVASMFPWNLCYIILIINFKPKPIILMPPGREYFNHKHYNRLITCNNQDGYQQNWSHLYIRHDCTFPNESIWLSSIKIIKLHIKINMVASILLLCQLSFFFHIAIVSYFWNLILKALWLHVPSGNGYYCNFRFTFLFCLKSLSVSYQYFSGWMQFPKSRNLKPV